MWPNWLSILISLLSLTDTQLQASLEGFYLSCPHKCLIGLSMLRVLCLPYHCNLIIFVYFPLISRFCFSPSWWTLITSSVIFLYKAALPRVGNLDSYWHMQTVGDQPCPIPHLTMAPKDCLWQFTSLLSRRVLWWIGGAGDTQLLLCRESLKLVSGIHFPKLYSLHRRHKSPEKSSAWLKDTLWVYIFLILTRNKKNWALKTVWEF